MFSKSTRFVGAFFAFVMLTAVAVMPALSQDAVIDSVNASPYTMVYDEVSPSVVSINVVTSVSESESNPLMPEGEFRAGGSGFIYDTEGHIITNNHVVENADQIEVNFLDGTLVPAEVVGLDPSSDLAVIKVDLPAEQLQPVTFANSDELVIGEYVVAIGSPFGQRWTLTSGIVSALDRTMQGLTNFSIGGVIQTDAAVNPGNSGGPLLDLNGQVVGVNSQIASASGSNSGVGFAIPSNLTQRVARDLIDRGYVDYSYLGIQGGNVTLDLIEALNLSNNMQGVVVSEAVAGGPAARGGLNTAEGLDTLDEEAPTVDIITAINGTPLRGIGDLITYLAKNTAPDETVTLSVLRNGTEEIQLDVTLTPRPA